MKSILLLLAVAIVASCQHSNEDPWAGKLYVGDAKQGAAVRAQTGEVVPATDERFDGMFCMSSDDFEHFAERYHYFTEQCLVAKPDATPPAEDAAP